MPLIRARRSASRSSRWFGAGVGVVEAADRLVHRQAADEPHGVAGVAGVVLAHAVDRHDPRVFEPAGDLGLAAEPLAGLAVGGVLGLEELQRDLTAELGVVRLIDLAQPAAGVEPKFEEAPSRMRISGPLAHGCRSGLSVAC